jgi:hypothetical protein
MEEKDIPFNEMTVEKVARLCNEMGLNGARLVHVDQDHVTQRWHFGYESVVLVGKESLAERTPASEHPTERELREWSKNEK